MYYGPRSRNPNLSDQMRGLLDTIASTESDQKRPDGGYGQAYYTNNKFDINNPATYNTSGPILSGPNKGLNSTAKGRYQFKNDTLAENSPVDPNTGRPSLQPQAQDAAAAKLAKDRYDALTGSDLESDLGDPSKYGQIGRTLSGTWTSLPSGIETTSNNSVFGNTLADRIKNYTDRTYVATADPATLSANSMAADSGDRFNARQATIDARNAPQPSFLTKVGSAIEAPFGAIGEGFKHLFTANPNQAPTPPQNVPTPAPPAPAPAPFSMPARPNSQTPPSPFTGPPAGIGSLNTAPAPSMPSMPTAQANPMGIGGLTSPAAPQGPMTLGDHIAQAQRPISTLQPARPYSPTPSPAPVQQQMPRFTGPPISQGVPQMPTTMPAPAPQAPQQPAPTVGSGPYMASDLRNMDASEQARMQQAANFRPVSVPQAPQITKMPTAPAPAPMSMSQVSQQAVNAQPPASAVQGLQSATPPAQPQQPTPSLSAIGSTLMSGNRALSGAVSPLFSGIGSLPGLQAPAVTPGAQVGTTGMPAGPEMSPAISSTPRPTTMQQAKTIAGGVGKFGKGMLGGAKVGSIVGGPIGGLVGAGLGGGAVLANMAMNHFGTNMNNLFGGPQPTPGSQPATMSSLAPGSARSLLGQVNRMDYGPAPQGQHYAYSPFGNNVSVQPNSQSDFSQVAGTGPGILGAFGFGTSKDGYNNGAAAAAQNAATNTAKATQSKTDTKNNQSQSQSSSGSKTSSSSSGSSGKTGGGMNGSDNKNKQNP